MRDEAATPGGAGLVPTATRDGRPRRFADFPTLGDALDYAAEGPCGLNFHDPRGALARAYSYRELRHDARTTARRLIARGVMPGDRIALVAETAPEFVELFFGAVYAGAWPVPLPLPTSFGGRDSYIDQLRVQLASADAKFLFFPEELEGMATAAAAAAGVEALAWGAFARENVAPAELPTARPDDIAYLQYSSGSTRFPHGVAVTHRALLSNLAAHSHGMALEDDDRGISWLPLYHDMGLVGCMLSPMANQMSVDYLKTEDFARRPLAWLDLISRNPGTSMSYSPTFGYDICARRMSSQMKASTGSTCRWRIAGNGADMIRPDVNAGVCRRVRRGRVRGFVLPTLLRARRGDAGGLDHAAGRRHRRRTGRGDRALRRRRRARAAATLPRRGQLRQAGARHGGPDPRGGRHPPARARDRQGLVPRLVGHAQLFPRRGGDRRGDGRWLARHRRHGLSERRLHLHRRPRQGHDHHQRQEPLAARHRMGGGAAARLQGGRHRGLRDHHPRRRGDARRARPVPHLRPAERTRLRDEIRDRVRAITGMNCVIELVPPKALPRTSSGKLSRAKARNLYLSGEIQPYAIAA